MPKLNSSIAMAKPVSNPCPEDDSNRALYSVDVTKVVPRYISTLADYVSELKLYGSRTYIQGELYKVYLNEYKSYPVRNLLSLEQAKTLLFDILQTSHCTNDGHSFRIRNMDTNEFIAIKEPRPDPVEIGFAPTSTSQQPLSTPGINCEFLSPK